MLIIKNAMLKTLKLEIPIFSQDVWVILGPPYEVQDYLHDVYDGDFSFNPNQTNAICLHQGTTSWIWWDEKSITIPILVHELGHGTFDLMEDLGILREDQEVFCYIQEWLLTQILTISHTPMVLTNPALTLEDEQVSS